MPGRLGRAGVIGAPFARDEANPKAGYARQSASIEKRQEDTLVAEWVDDVEELPLAHVIGIGATAVADDVSIEFLSMEIRGTGGFLLMRVLDRLGRDDLNGPMNAGSPLLTITDEDGRIFEPDEVMADLMDANRIRYRIAIRPRPRAGASLIVRVEGFDHGMLANLPGPWVPPPIDIPDA